MRRAPRFLFRRFRAFPPERAGLLAFALGAVAVAVFLAGNLGPVPDQETGVAGELILSLRDDLDYELLSDEFAARDAGAVQPVSLVQLLHNTAGVGSIC